MTPTQARLNLIIYDNSLLFMISDAIILSYPINKGGTNDCNGRSTDRRGGSSETENASRYRCPAAASWQDPCLQVRGIMASQAVGFGAIRRGSEVYQEEELISVSSVTTQRTAITIGTRLTERCQLSLLRVHSMTLSYGKSRGWYGVAGGVLL
jgi:hypothetical protein